MSRCNHCSHRFSWDCEDWRPSNHVLCKDFELDFSTLDVKFRESIQKLFMDEHEHYTTVSEWEEI